MIAFPFIVPEYGYVRIRRPEAHEVIDRDVKNGDVFSVSPEGILHHNHDEVCPFNAVKGDTFDFVAIGPEDVA